MVHTERVQRQQGCRDESAGASQGPNRHRPRTQTSAARGSDPSAGSRQRRYRPPPRPAEVREEGDVRAISHRGRADANTRPTLAARTARDASGRRWRQGVRLDEKNPPHAIDIGPGPGGTQSSWDHRVFTCHCSACFSTGRKWSCISWTIRGSWFGSRVEPSSGMKESEPLQPQVAEVPRGDQD